VTSEVDKLKLDTVGWRFLPDGWPSIVVAISNDWAKWK
jgi:hypothetical protein